MGDNRNRFGLTEAEKGFIKGHMMTESEGQKKTKWNKKDSGGRDQGVYVLKTNSHSVSSGFSLHRQSAGMNLSTQIKLYRSNAWYSSVALKFTLWWERLITLTVGFSGVICLPGDPCYYLKTLLLIMLEGQRVSPPEILLNILQHTGFNSFLVVATVWRLTPWCWPQWSTQGASMY